MANTIIKGGDLMCFLNDKSIAYATSHTLSLSGETTDTSSKDHGVYGAVEVTKVNWEITSENLYTSEAYNELFDAMIARTAVSLKWSPKKENDPTKTVVDGDYDSWTPAASGFYEGEAYITSLVTNAANGENATFSVTFTGIGKIARAA